MYNILYYIPTIGLIAAILNDRYDLMKNPFFMTYSTIGLIITTVIGAILYNMITI